MYFETHAHYDDNKFGSDYDLENIIKKLKNNNVSKVINVGVHQKSNKKSIDLANKYDFFYCSVGFHPHNVQNISYDDLDNLKNLCSHEKVVALGEIGLDYYYNFSDKNLQQKWFYEQISLANDLDLPIIVHSREACANTLEIISKSNVRKKGVLHCFSGSLEIAKTYVNMGFYLGIGGVVTFNNAKKLHEVVKEIDLENILIETDCPYLAPVPMRGTTNDSSNLKFIVENIAKIKNLSFEEVCSKTYDNAKKLFLSK